LLPVAHLLAWNSTKQATTVENRKLWLLWKKFEYKAIIRSSSWILGRVAESIYNPLPHNCVCVGGGGGGCSMKEATPLSITYTPRGTHLETSVCCGCPLTAHVAPTNWPVERAILCGICGFNAAQPATGPLPAGRQLE